MSASDELPEPPPFAPFPVESSETLYESPWCGLRRDVVRLADGRLQDYHVVEITGAVAVVPVLPDGSLVLLWQHRHPHGGTHWEIPAGRLNPGERPEDGAARELLEETGYRADSLERLAGFYPTNGISAHWADLFVARGCRRVADPDHDAAERMSVHVVGAGAVRAHLAAGGFEDGFTALGLFYHFARGG